METSISIFEDLPNKMTEKEVKELHQWLESVGQEGTIDEVVVMLKKSDDL